MSTDSVKDIPEHHHVHRVGDWLPQDHRAHHRWLNGIVNHVDENPKDLHTVLQEFQQLIERDARVYMLMTSMFEEVPKKKQYRRDPTGGRQVRDWQHMLRLLNHLMTTAPAWTRGAADVHMVGLPINAVLDWPMGTPSGYAAFLDPKVNKMLKKVLDAWGKFLSSPESAKQVLHVNDGGWFADTGRTSLESVANKAVGKQTLRFDELFQCDSSEPSFGFSSWDDFFTRQFRDNIRPVASPNDDNIVANACESKPFNFASNISLRDKFWVKGQPYSALDILGHDPLAQQFSGGSVYQAFLSALSYHRWHSPVSGVVKRAFLIEGTYYSEPLWETTAEPTKTRKGDNGIEMAGETVSQGYLTAVATRAVILIEANNPKIGLIAFIGVGMSEVSTCEMTVKEGQRLEKGEELGMFHFGGSTHCVMFREGVQLEGLPEPGRKENVPVRGYLCRVVS